MSAPLSPSGVGARQRFHKEESTKNYDDEDPKNHNKVWKNLVRKCWERYKRTPFRKKMRQFFWMFIMFQSMKMIFLADLDSGKVQTQMQMGYDISYVSSKTVSKSFLGNEDRKEASLFTGLGGSSSLNKFDGLADDDVSGKSSLSSESKVLGSSQLFGSGSIKGSDSLYGSNTPQRFAADNTAQTNTYSNGVESSGLSGSGSFVKSYGGAQPIPGLSSSNLRFSSGNSPLTDSFSASDKFGSSGSDKFMSSYGNSLGVAGNNGLSRSDSANPLGNPQIQQGLYASSDNSISLRGNSAQSNSNGAAGNIAFSASGSFANSFDSSQSQQKSYARNNLGVSNGVLGITDSFGASNKLSSAGSYAGNSHGNSLSNINTFGAADRLDRSDTLNTPNDSFGGSSRLDFARLGMSHNSFDNPPPQMNPLSASKGLGLDRFNALSGSHGNSMSQVKSFDALGMHESGLDRLGKSLSDSLLQTEGFNPTGRLVSGDNILQANLLGVDRSASFRGFESDLNPLQDLQGANPIKNTDLRIDERSNNNLKQQSSIAGLNCESHGGPSQKDSNELIYWRDIPSDATFTSMFYSPKSQEQSYEASNSFWKTKYLTFEMDSSGWNNIRLGLENIMLLAHTMGRTLVMPPKRHLAHGLVSTE